MKKMYLSFNWSFGACIFSALAVITLFSWALWQNVLNIPTLDDFAATLGFLRYYTADHALASDKIQALFVPHNEHIIFMSRLTSLVYFKLFGKINFADLILIQNLYLLGTFSLLLLVARQLKLPIWGHFLVTLFLFNLSFWQVSLYYWGGIQHYVVTFFTILSLYLLNRVSSNRWMFPLALVFAFLATLSFANGILVFLLGSLILWAKNENARLRIWIFASFFPVLMLVWQMPGAGVGKAPYNIEWIARLFFTFLGSALYVNPEQGSVRNVNIIICFLAGIGVLIFWLKCIFDGYWKRRPLLFALLSYTILTGMIIAVGRFELKAAGGIAPRYMFFTTIIPVIIILILHDQGWLTVRRLKPILMAGVCVWVLGYHFNLLEIARFKSEQLKYISVWKNHSKNPSARFMEKDAAHFGMMDWCVANKIIEPQPSLPRPLVKKAAR